MSEQLLTIGEVASVTGTSVHALRFFERQQLWIRPIDRDGAGRRRYHPEDVEWIKLCTRLRETGMPIARLRAFTELVKQGPGNEPARLELLLGHQRDVCNRIDGLQRALAVITAKVETYRAHLDDGTAEGVWAQPTTLP